MKHLLFTLIALSCLCGTLTAQTLPDAPTPAPPNPAGWNLVKNLTNGEPIVVRDDNGPPVHCLFAGASDLYLFCNPPGNPPGVGFRFDRTSIVSVDLDLPPQKNAQFDRPQTNYHPAWIASILAGGLVTGIIATRSTNNGNAAKAGLIGALVVGAIGAPLAFLPHAQDDGFAYRSGAFSRARIPHPHPLPHVFSIR
ncbi:MAG: hypothetical protein ACLQHF_00105 [Terracidiphilus sp.]